MRLNLNLLSVVVFVIGMTSGCGSSPKKAEIPADLGPDEIVEMISSLQDETEEKRGDLLFYKDYTKADEYFDKVKGESQKTDVNLNEIRKNAGYSKYLYKKIISKSKKIDSKLKPILSARDLALEAGIKKYAELVKELEDVDSDFRNKSKDFKKKLNPENFGEFQKRYLTLEAAGITKQKLSKSAALIEAAKDNGAKSKATLSYENALKSLAAAENLITSSPSDSKRFKESVKTARRDAIFLSEVMKTIESSKRPLSENIARKLVKSEQKVKKQEEKIEELEGHVEVQDEKAKNDSEEKKDNDLDKGQDLSSTEDESEVDKDCQSNKEVSKLEDK